MLADARRISALAQALAVERDGERRHVDRLAARARFQQAAGGVKVRIVEQVPGFGDRRERHADLLELGGELALRILARELVDSGNEPGARLHPLAVCPEAWIRSKLVEPEFAAECFPLGFG